MRAREFISKESYNDDLNQPRGPEFRPTMPRGTVRVNVSDVYDWYKLGRDIANLDRANPKTYGKGPPSTIVSFGDEDTEHEYINGLKRLGLSTVDIDPADPKQPAGMPRQPTDPTYNVDESGGKQQDLDEVTIDNRQGWGSTPYNQDVDYFGLRVQMQPRTFLKLAAPLMEPTSQKDIEQHIQSGGAIGAPFLMIDIPEEWIKGNVTEPAQITGHEGRNRMRAIQRVEGNAPVEVHLFFPGLRRRHLTDTMIERLNQGMNAERIKVEVPGPLFTV